MELRHFIAIALFALCIIGCFVVMYVTRKKKPVIALVSIVLALLGTILFTAYVLPWI
ncbi:MAG: hypothetical protein IKM60_00555 [Clostridia bacterium]|nr:hypothetical protein [Clostridia bacterium]